MNVRTFCLLMLVPGVALGQAAFTLPRPSGPLAIGSSSFSVERLGQESPLIVVAWYPAADTAGLTRAPYLRDESALRLMAAIGRNPAANALAARNVRTHSWLDAPIARLSRPLPVLLFSHGYIGLTSDYTALMEDLASHGYAVFSVAHTGESMAVSLSPTSAHIVMTADNELEPLVRGVVGEWGSEDSVAAAVTSAPNPAQAEATLRWYLASIPNSTAAVQRWADHLQLVLDTLVRLSAPDAPSPFSGRLDLTRVGVFGHSMGGVASAAFCARETRCRAAINLDGSPQYGDLIDRPSARAFLMVYSARPERVGVSDLIYSKGAAYWRAVLRGSLHLNFGDWQFRQGADRLARALGDIPAARSAEIVHRLVREFFATQLDAVPSALLSGRVYEELEVRRVP